MTVVLTPISHLVAVPVSPNHALQRTPGFGVQLPGAALIRPAQSLTVLPAMKPSTARAFASRRRAHSRAPGPESLSLGSLGVATRVVFNEAFSPLTQSFMPSSVHKRNSVLIMLLCAALVEAGCHSGPKHTSPRASSQVH